MAPDVPYIGVNVTDQAPLVVAADADVDHGRAGRTISAVTMCGTPTAATMMSARRVSSGRCRVAVWHTVTVAFSDRRVSSRPSGLA